MRLVILISCILFSSHAYAQENIIDLERALKLALDSHPGLRAAEWELEETKEVLPQARAGWLPTLTVVGSITATSIDSSNFSNGDGATTKDITASIDQPIWRGGRTFAENARAKDLIRAGESVLNSARQDILARTAISYFDVLRDQNILKLRIQNENILKQELKAAKQRKELGSGTITDVYQADASLMRARTRTINAERNLFQSEAGLEEMINIPGPHLLQDTMALIEFPATTQEMITIAYDHNPEIAFATFEQQAAEHNTAAIFRELFPQISGFASYNKQYDPQPGIVPESQTDTVGVRMSLTLFQGGATRSRIREARKAAMRQQFEIQDIKHSVRRSVVRDFKSYQAAELEMKAREKEIALARNALEGVRTEVKAGQRTFSDILDSDEDLIDAQIAHARAVHNLNVSQYNLAATLGILNTHADTLTEIKN